MQEQFTWFLETWVKEKERATKTKDYKIYRFFLEEARKEFSRIYADMTNDAWLGLMETLLENISCELKKIDINCNIS